MRRFGATTVLLTPARRHFEGLAEGSRYPMRRYMCWSELCPRQDSKLRPSAPEADSVRLLGSTGVCRGLAPRVGIACDLRAFVRFGLYESTAVRAGLGGEFRMSCDNVVTPRGALPPPIPDLVHPRHGQAGRSASLSPGMPCSNPSVISRRSSPSASSSAARRRSPELPAPWKPAQEPRPRPSLFPPA